MVTLTENVNAVKSAFSGIKAAIEEKGVTVESGTPVTEYPALIGNISSGSGSSVKSYILSNKHSKGIFTEVTD